MSAFWQQYLITVTTLPVFVVLTAWVLRQIPPPLSLAAELLVCAVSTTILGVIMLAAGQWAISAGDATVAVSALTVWWWRRRKDRKRALAAIGAKARARIAAMVRKVRESAKPKPVLKPQRVPA